MNIEVTKETFFKVFNKDHYLNTDEHEYCRKHYYANEDQQGIKVCNFLSVTEQYYLTDINA